jgi:HTH-type transcriptional regulator/antitoxin HigA
MALQAKNRQQHHSYLDLVRHFPLRPIRSDEELNQAIAMVDLLIDRSHLQPAEKDYLDVLSDLVERYETEYHAILPLPDGELLQHLIATKGVSQAQTAHGANIAESTISEVIAGRRRLSRGHIGKLSRYFGVPPGAFSFEA